MRKPSVLILSIVALLSFAGMIVALVLERGFRTWAGIALGVTLLALLPLAIGFLMYLGTRDERIVKPSEKDKESQLKK